MYISSPIIAVIIFSLVATLGAHGQRWRHRLDHPWGMAFGADPSQIDSVSRTTVQAATMTAVPKDTFGVNTTGDASSGSVTVMSVETTPSGTNPGFDAASSSSGDATTTDTASTGTSGTNSTDSAGSGASGPSTASTASSDASSSSSGSGDYNSPVEGSTWQEAVLNSHNHWRNLHGAAPATYSEGLASALEAVKGKCPSDDVAVQFNNEGAGSNWAGASSNGGGTLTPSQASALVDSWYSEIKFIPAKVWTESDAQRDADLCNANLYPAGETILHFTQVVWNASTSIGCVYSDTCSDGMATQLTCAYQVTGNLAIGGALNYAANVFPPKQ